MDRNFVGAVTASFTDDAAVTVILVLSIDDNSIAQSSAVAKAEGVHNSAKSVVMSPEVVAIIVGVGKCAASLYEGRYGPTQRTTPCPMALVATCREHNYETTRA